MYIQLRFKEYFFEKKNETPNDPECTDNGELSNRRFVRVVYSNTTSPL